MVSFIRLTLAGRKAVWLRPDRIETIYETGTETRVVLVGDDPENYFAVEETAEQVARMAAHGTEAAPRLG